jgi:hypothetical protein
MIRQSFKKLGSGVTDALEYQNGLLPNAGDFPMVTYFYLPSPSSHDALLFTRYSSIEFSLLVHISSIRGKQIGN